MTDSLRFAYTSVVRFNRFAFVEILDRSGYPSRAAFARAVGMSVGALHDIVSGRRQPSSEMIQRFSRELKAPIPALIHERQAA